MQPEKSQYFPCPKFREFYRIEEENAQPGQTTGPRGTCGFVNHPQVDGVIPGSCQYKGNANLCLRAHTDVSEKLKTELENRTVSLETEAEYFKGLLKASAYFPLKILSPAELVKNGMDKLANYEGKAEITFVQDCEIQPTQKVTLKKFNRMDGCLVFDEGKSSLPILGGVGVQRVTNEDGNVLYVNPEVDDTFQIAKCDEIRKKCGLKPLFLRDARRQNER